MTINNININRAYKAYANHSPAIKKPIAPDSPSLMPNHIQHNNAAKSTSALQESVLSMMQDRVNNIIEAERISKVAIAKPESINVETVVHQVAKAEDSIKELTTVISSTISAYQRIINMQI